MENTRRHERDFADPVLEESVQNQLDMDPDSCAVVEVEGAQERNGGQVYNEMRAIKALSLFNPERANSPIEVVSARPVPVP